MKTYEVQNNIGKAKYVVSYHNGQSTHQDGSKFYDIRIANNKKKLKEITGNLKAQGYTEK